MGCIHSTWACTISPYSDLPNTKQFFNCEITPAEEMRHRAIDPGPEDCSMKSGSWQRRHNKHTNTQSSLATLSRYQEAVAQRRIPPPLAKFLAIPLSIHRGCGNR